MQSITGKPLFGGDGRCGIVKTMGVGNLVGMVVQIGCGKSFLASENRGPTQQDISVDMFVDELAAVKQALGLQEHHILGHGTAQPP